jgi:hypothetical protein
MSGDSKIDAEYQVTIALNSGFGGNVESNIIDIKSERFDVNDGMHVRIPQSLEPCHRKEDLCIFSDQERK